MKNTFKPGLIWLPYTAFVWFLTVLVFSTHYALFLLLKPFFSDSEEMAFQLSRGYIYISNKLLGFRTTVEGKENVPAGPFILVCNHQSHIDIMTIMGALPHKASFITKKELLNVPILGWDIRAQGHVPIDRHAGRAAVLELKKIEAMAEKGRSFILFPEGTRSMDGTIGPLKKGAFMMAANTGVQLLPCYIDGTIRILHKTTLLLRPGKIKFVIGKPIPAYKQTSLPAAKAEADRLMSLYQAFLEQQLAASKEKSTVLTN